MSRLSKIIRTLFSHVPRRPFPHPSGRKPPLLLHIGPHKTGTTAIQIFCERNRTQLARAGFWYPEVGIEGAQHLVLPACYFSQHPFIPESLLGGDPEELVDNLAAEVPRGLTPLMSSEVFWRLLSQRSGAFESVVALLGRHFNVHIVVVERPERERLWSGIKHRCRQGFPIDASTELLALRKDYRRNVASLLQIGCPVIRIPYNDADCVTAFLEALSTQRFLSQTVRPRYMKALLKRCGEESLKRRENVAPQEPWFVAFTMEFSRRLHVERDPGGSESRIAIFLQKVLAIGSELESIRFLPDEPTVLHRVFEARGSLDRLLTPMEVQAWESICRHPSVHQVAMSTGCADDLRLVCQRRSRPEMLPEIAACGGLVHSLRPGAAGAGPVVLAATLAGCAMTESPRIMPPASARLRCSQR